jgi:UDP-N-acetylmuramate--alanine ligase
MPVETFFFCGVGGSGMAPLAAWLRAQGFAVRGSDRAYDQRSNPAWFQTLASSGIQLFPQDGSGVGPGVKAVVVSSAIEEQVPDVQAARRNGVPIRKRAEVLADCFNRRWGIAVGGTSGKSTVTGMLGHVFAVLGRDPTVVNGGEMLNLEAGALRNARIGRGPVCVIEADESDRTIELYRPQVSVLTNVSLDHQPMDVLEKQFGDFLRVAQTGCVINGDCEVSCRLAQGVPSVRSFSRVRTDADGTASRIRPVADGSCFEVQGRSYHLRVPGRHNVANALAAAVAAGYAGVSLDDALQALESFAGIRRRLEVLGTANGVTVIDDFAHNPDKIRASLESLHEYPGRLAVIFQPHGFGPTRFLWDGLVSSFREGLRAGDRLALLPIFYAGGTADQTLASSDLGRAIAAEGEGAVWCPETRESAIREVLDWAKAGDRVVVMGARDPTLTGFGRRILEGLA